MSVCKRYDIGRWTTKPKTTLQDNRAQHLKDGDSGRCLLVLLAFMAVSMAQSTTQAVEPPVAEIKPQRLEKHGHLRVDNYYWLRERENPQVISYLEQENAYTDAVMAPTKGLQEKLFQEMKGRIKETDTSVAVKRDDYYYYRRDEEGKQYPIYCRKRGSMEAAEEIMLDVNRLAQGHAFCSVRSLAVSFKQDILAYAADFVGRRKYTIYFKNLTTGELLRDRIPDSTPNIAWANDNQTLFYTKQHPGTLRYYQIYRHQLGTDDPEDALVYEERDEEFRCSVSKTKSKEYLVIQNQQTLSSECMYMRADNPTGAFKVFLPREENHEYRLDHLGDHFYIRTNLKARNFRLMKTALGRTSKDAWQEVIPHREDVFLNGFQLFQDYLVIQERSKALIQMRIMPWNGGKGHYLDFGEPAYTAGFHENPSLNTHLLRYRYTSLTTPDSTYEYNMQTREKRLLKQKEVLGGFKPEDYKTERLWAAGRDGVKVPISVVYRKDFVKDGTGPLYLYAYGSYGYSTDARFNSVRLSLLDRGFAYAIAHVRGGQEMGRHWYEDGKLFKKKSTFTDFIDCAEHLIRERYTSSDRLFAAGGSAGGLLMGAVNNMRPDLFKGIIAFVPWVDVVTTMLDDSIPLTTEEYDEWGNPNEKAFYDYMLSYSPYDNVEHKSYPNLFVITSLEDSQVQYWEPAKWVAKLRAFKTDKNRLLLQTDMKAGHGGVSGRYNALRKNALYYAFVFNLLGIDS